MKRLLIICILFVSAGHLSAQQKPVYSQYLFNALAINPAFAGSQEMVSVTAIYRNQWVNFPGAPQIKTLTGNSAIAGRKIGLGFVLTDDRIGVHNDLGLSFSYAYRIKLREAALSFGVSGGVNYLRSDFSQLTIFDLNDPNLTGAYSRFIPNFGTGVFYVNSTSYIGFSIPSLINSKVNRDIFSLAQLRRYYFLSAGHVFKVNHMLKFKPSTLIRFQEKTALGVDINLQFIFYDKVSIGNSYRTGDANITNFEIQFNQNFRIGYAYEYVLSRLDNFTQGSHEVMLNYRIDIPALRRTVECPTFF